VKGASFHWASCLYIEKNKDTGIEENEGPAFIGNEATGFIGKFTVYASASQITGTMIWEGDKYDPIYGKTYIENPKIDCNYFTESNETE